MKKIFFLVLLFVCFQSYGQNRFPSIDSAKNYTLRYIRNSTVEAFTNLRMQNVTYGTLQLLDSLAGAGVVDTIFKSGDTLKYKIGSTTFTVGTFGGGSLTLQQVTDNGNITTDTIHVNSVGLYDSPNDTYTNLSVNEETFSIKNLRGTNGYNVAFTFPTDNISRGWIFPKKDGTIPISIRLNGTTYTSNDTGSIELGSITGTDTTSLSNRINAKQDALVSGTNIKTINGSSLLGSGNLTISGGGGDSSWLSTETGTAYNTVGTIFQTTFSGASLPAAITDVTPDATVTVNNRLELSGGVTTTAPLIGNQGTATAYTNRLDFGFYPQEKLRYSTTIIPQDKTATSYGIAFHFQSNSLFFNTAMRVRYNLSTGADSGRILIDYDLGTTVAQSGNLSFNTGDTLDVDLIRDYWTITAKMYNRRTGKYADVIYTSALALGTGGKFYMGVLGGSQYITRFKIESYNRTSYGFTFLGDSQTAGSGASSEEKSFASLVFRGNESKYSNLSNPSVTLAAMPNSHVPSAITIGNPVIITAGYNDRRDLSTDTNTYRQRLDSVIQPLRRANLSVYLATLVPNAAGTNNNFNTVITNLATTYSLPVIRIDTVLRISGANFNIKANYLSNDGVHLSDSGNIVVANEIIKALGVEVSTLFKDSTSPVVFNDIPTGVQTMPHLVIDNRGRVYQQPNRPFNGIQNVFNGNGAGTNAQANSQIHVSSTVVTDSAIYVHASTGLKLGFNGGSNIAAGSTGSNVIMSNRGVAGTGYPQAWPTVTGASNFISETLTSKSGSAFTLSGNRNFYSNTTLAGTASGSDNISINSTFGLTSGSNNIFLGASSGTGITTGSRNIHFITKNTSAYGGVNTTDAMIFGEYTTTSDNAWANNDVSFGHGIFQTTNFWFGGRTMGGLEIGMNFPAVTQVSNFQGCDAHFKAGRGRGTGRSGYFKFSTWNSVASGSTLHSVENQEIVIYNDSIQIDAIHKTNSQIQIATKLNVAATGGYSVASTDHYIELPDLAGQANRTLTLPTNSGVGRVLIIKNKNSDGGNTWSFNIAVKDKADADVTAIANDQVYHLLWNGTNWVITMLY